MVDWPTIAVASQQKYVSLYICAMEGREYIAEKYKQSLASHVGKTDLGKVSVGRSCIRFKKIEDLNLESLKKLLLKWPKNLPDLEDTTPVIKNKVNIYTFITISLRSNISFNLKLLQNNGFLGQNNK